MNLPLFLPGMQNFIVVYLAFLTGAAIAVYLLKYKFKKSAVRKCLIVVVLAIIGMVLVYILFCTVSNMIGRSQVEIRLKEMREQGVPQLHRRGVAPNTSDNGAHFYKAVFELMEVSSSHKVLCDIQFKQQTCDIVLWPEQNRNTAQQLFKNKDLELILNLFHQGAEKPCAIYSHDYQGVKTMLPELTSPRDMFRIISMKSSLDGLNGNSEAGFSLIRDGFMNVKQLESEPFIISQLVNMACASMNIDAMNMLISHCGISRQNAEQILAELNKIDFKVGMVHGIDGDIMMGRKTFEDFMRENELYCMKVLMMYNPLFPAGPFFYQDYSYYLTRQTGIRKLYSQPYWLESEELKKLSSNIPYHYFISAILLQPSMINARTKVAQIESEIDAAKLTLALHIYKNQHGEFPEKLEELAPGILKEIPVDPISGKPFEYQKTDKTFTISSVWLKEKAEIYRKNRSMHNSGK
jgi:hypothetical protein